MTQTLNGDAGNNTLTGTDPGNPANPDGIDIINGLDGNDTLSGLGGDDTISGGLGADVLDGGAGFDTLTFANATAGVWVNINAGAFGGEAVGDTMTGFEAIIGSNFNDIFGGDGGNNTISGGAGTDIISISGGTDFLDGGANGDYLDCRTSGSAVIINVATGIGGGGAAGTTFANFESIIATNFNDVLTAAVGGSTLGGLGGDDTINGGDGNDVLVGDDFLNVIGTSGVDTLSGGAGNDYLQGGALGDILNGGADSDTAGYENSDAGVIVNVDTGAASGGHAQGDTLIGIENVIGSTFDDFFGASAAANFFDGRAGGDAVTYGGSTAGVLANLNGGIGVGGWAEGDTFANMENLIGSNFSDTLYGNGVNNILDGGNGNDVLEGLVGADTLQGGNGSDTAAYVFSAAGVTVDLKAAFYAGGDAQGDVLQSIENLTGSGFADTLRGDDGANVIDGGGGNDNIASYGGADAINGGAGIDTVFYDVTAVTVNLATGQGFGGDAQGDTYQNVENVVGTAANDTLIGDAGANGLTGGDGDDTIRSAAGNDAVSGGNGNDLINAGAGADVIDGGAGIDTLYYDSSTVGVAANLANGTGLSGDAQGDTLTGIENLVGSGFNDTLTGDGGANSLTGGDGDDALHGGAGADVLAGGNGQDGVDYTGSAAVSVNLLTGTGTGGDAQGDTLTGIENLFGTTFADTLTGDAGANILGAGDGDDVLLGGGGADQLRGGNGIDTASYAGSAVGVQISLATGTGTGGDAQGDTLTAIENLIGSSFNDTLTGGAGANDLRGDVGDDVIRGGAGADRIGGGAGVDTADYAGSAVGVTIDLVAGTGTGGDAQGDTLFSIENVTGSAFADTLYGDGGANALTGGAGSDILVGGAGADTLDGGAGTDTVRYNTSTTAVTVDLGAGTGTGGDAQGDVLANIEWLGGSAFNDTLTGNAGANQIAGGGGADTIAGAAGNDTVYGGNGNDQVDGGDGWDILQGDAGDDQLTGGAGGDTLRGGLGADHLTGGADFDTASYWDSAVGVTINLATNVNIGGTAQGDTIDTDVETINGSNHNDVMTGNGLANALLGFDGADTLSGGGGADVLRGGAGADVLNGGAGNDFFSYTAISDSTAAAADTIQDFQAGTDLISLREIDADGNGANGDTAFSFIGTGAFSDVAGQLRYETAGSTTTVSADVNGDGSADIVIHLTGAITLTAGDFLL